MAINEELEEKLMQALFLMQQLIDTPQSKHFRKKAQAFIDDNTPQQNTPTYDASKYSGNSDDLLF